MPLPNRSFSRLERIYVTLESTFGTAVAPTNNNCVRSIKTELTNDIAVLTPRDKTGTRSVPEGARGRAAGRWSYQGSLYASGTGGTAPDADPLFQLLFGQAPTTGGGTVTYALSDNIISGNFWSYRRPSTIEQRVALGAVLTNFQFNLGQDIAEWSCDGECMYVLGSSNFSSMDTTQKGGLASFPVEPSAPVTNYGGVIAGFTGAITIDSQTLALIRTATIKGNTGNQLIRDVFNTYYAVATQGDARNFTFSFNTYDEDSAGLAALKLVADNKTPVSATLQVGTVTGNIFTFTLNGIQLQSQTYDDSQLSFTVDFPDSRVHGSSLTALDELQLVVS